MQAGGLDPPMWCCDTSSMPQPVNGTKGAGGQVVDFRCDEVCFKSGNYRQIRELSAFLKKRARPRAAQRGRGLPVTEPLSWGECSAASFLEGQVPAGYSQAPCRPDKARRGSHDQKRHER